MVGSGCRPPHPERMRPRRSIRRFSPPPQGDTSVARALRQRRRIHSPTPARRRLTRGGRAGCDGATPQCRTPGGETVSEPGGEGGSETRMRVRFKFVRPANPREDHAASALFVWSTPGLKGHPTHPPGPSLPIHGMRGDRAVGRRVKVPISKCCADGGYRAEPGLTSCQ